MRAGWKKARWRRAGWRRDDSSDRGSATVWSLGVIAVFGVVFVVFLALGQAVVNRHRAAGGADLAALAAADHWADGTTGACARADRVARAQGTRLVRCVLVGEISDVTAAAGGGPFVTEVRARAGPPGPDSDLASNSAQSSDSIPGQGSVPAQDPIPAPEPSPADAPAAAPAPARVPAPAPVPP